MEAFNCRDMEAVLSGLLDGELDVERSHLAEVHLSDCDSCKVRVQTAEEQDQLMRETMAALEDWPGEVERRIWSHVNGPKWALETARRLRWSAWSGWITAAAAVLIIGVLLTESFSNSKSTLNGPGMRADRETMVNPPSPDEIPYDVVSQSSNSMTANAHNASTTNQPSMIDRSAHRPGRMYIFFRDAQSGSWALRGAVQSDLPGNQYSKSMWPIVVPENRVVVRSAGRIQRQPAVVFDPFDEVGDNPQGQSNREWSQFFDEMAMAMVQQRSAQKKNHFHIDVGPITAKTTTTVVDSVDQQKALTVTNDDQQWRVDVGDDLHHAALLLNLLATADDQSFEDVNTIREILENDHLLDRLADSRSHLDAESVSVVNQAWTTLEWVHSPIDQSRLNQIQIRIRQTDMVEQIEDLSERVW